MFFIVLNGIRKLTEIDTVFRWHTEHIQDLRVLSIGFQYVFWNLCFRDSYLVTYRTFWRSALPCRNPAERACMLSGVPSVAEVARWVRARVPGARRGAEQNSEHHLCDWYFIKYQCCSFSARLWTMCSLVYRRRTWEWQADEIGGSKIYSVMYFVLIGHLNSENLIRTLKDQHVICVTCTDTNSLWGCAGSAWELRT